MGGSTTDANGTGEVVPTAAIVIYHNPTCSASRKVLALIREAAGSVEPGVVEHFCTPPSRDELASLIRRTGISLRALLRRREAAYSDLGLDDPALSDDQLLDAMVAHPVLIERPVVATPLGTRLCRPAEVVLDILAPPRGVRPRWRHPRREVLRRPDSRGDASGQKRRLPPTL